MIRLPVPPSVNALFRNAAGKGRVKTGQYKAWLMEAGLKLKLQRPIPVLGRYTLLIRIPQSLQGDIDNRIKAVSDLLVTHEVVEDDRYAWRVTVERAAVQECEVELVSYV